MKKMRHFLSLIILLFGLLSATIAAHATEVDGIDYKIYISGSGDNAVADSAWVHDNWGMTLTEVIIPSSITFPYTYTINGATFTRYLSCPVTGINSWAFTNCENLTTVTIPNSVTAIGSYAFLDCVNLTNINIPNSIVIIGWSAFSGCNITNLTIPYSVSRIRMDAFSGCGNVKELTWNAKHCVSNGDMNTENIEKVTIGNEVEYLPGGFVHHSKITEITIPNSVDTIGGAAFRGCTGLTNIDIPNSVDAIGYAAFEDCTGLTSIDIPNHVRGIDGAAFSGCTGLTGSLDIPNSVITIGEKAFEDCSGLSQIIIGNSVTTIGEQAFLGCTGLTGSLDIPNSVISIGEKAFRDCSGLSKITIGNSVTGIMHDSFDGCRGVKTLYWNARNCQISDKDSWKGTSPFSGLDSVTHIVIGNEVEFIDDYMLRFGRSVDTVTCHAEIPPIITAKCFTDDTYSHAILRVPKKSKHNYREAEGWKEFERFIAIVEMPGDVDGDGKVNIDDVTTLINHLLKGSTSVSDGADANEDGNINIDDVTSLINKLLHGN